MTRQKQRDGTEKVEPTREDNTERLQKTTNPFSTVTYIRGKQGDDKDKVRRGKKRYKNCEEREKKLTGERT